MSPSLPSVSYCYHEITKKDKIDANFLSNRCPNKGKNDKLVFGPFLALESGKGGPTFELSWSHFVVLEIQVCSTFSLS